MSKPSDFTEVLSEDLLRQTAYCEVGSVEDSSILENCVETILITPRVYLKCL